MKLFNSTRSLSGLATAAFALAAASVAHAAPDAEAAKELARQNNCFKCHSVTKKKDGPSFHVTAEKYKDKPDAEARLYKHLTTGEKAKFPDGHEEDHKIIKADNDADIKNLIQWILSQ